MGGASESAFQVSSQIRSRNLGHRSNCGSPRTGWNLTGEGARATHAVDLRSTGQPGAAVPT